MNTRRCALFVARPAPPFKVPAGLDSFFQVTSVETCGERPRTGQSRQAAETAGVTGGSRYPKNVVSWAAFFMGAASGCAAYFFSRAERRQPERVLSLAGKR
jgi:hypothetical protein